MEFGDVPEDKDLQEVGWLLNYQICHGNVSYFAHVMFSIIYSSNSKHLLSFCNCELHTLNPGECMYDIFKSQDSNSTDFYHHIHPLISPLYLEARNVLSYWTMRAS